MWPHDRAVTGAMVYKKLKKFQLINLTEFFFRLGRDSILGPSTYQPGMLTIRLPVNWRPGKNMGRYSMAQVNPPPLHSPIGKNHIPLNPPFWPVWAARHYVKLKTLNAFYGHFRPFAHPMFGIISCHFSLPPHYTRQRVPKKKNFEMPLQWYSALRQVAAVLTNFPPFEWVTYLRRRYTVDEKAKKYLNLHYSQTFIP
jgi:hypothetical protein